MRRRLSWFCQFVLSCLLIAVLGYAQGPSTGAIRGRVIDPQGSAVTHAAITATNTATNISRSATTTSMGDYVIPYLAPGSYDIKVEAQGFGLVESKNVVINLGDQRDMNWQLRAGRAEITTAEESRLIAITKTDMSMAGTDLDVRSLPVLPSPNGIPFAGLPGSLNTSLLGIGGVAPSGAGANDFAQLALMAPGMKQDASGIAEFAGKSEGDLVAPGAINSRANVYNVDGANITDQLTSGRNGLGASLDEIQQFQVITGNYSAEYGQTGGLILNAVTKSGSNDIHGEGHMYFRGRNLAASNPFYNLGLSANAVPAGTAGPFGNPHCPTADFSAGDLTKVDGCDRAPFHRQEGGLTLGGPFIKERLFWFGSYELSRESVPLTLAPSFSSPTPSIVKVQQPTNNLLYSGKIDYRISPKHDLSVRYHAERSFQDNQVEELFKLILPVVPAGPEFLTTFNHHDAGINAGLVSSLTPTLVNEAHFAFWRSIDLLGDKSAMPAQIDFSLTGANICCPEEEKSKRYQYSDNLTWSHGAHTFKTGFNISSYPWSTVVQPLQGGLYLLSGPSTPLEYAFTPPGAGAVGSKDNIYGFYFQDTWTLAHNLTMNLGLRYDFEAGAFRGGPIAGPGGTCFQSNGIIPACSSDHNNWQPRLGFTWQPWQKTLFKASVAEVTVAAFNNVALASLSSPGPEASLRVTSDPAVLAAFPNAPNPALLASVPAILPSFIFPVRTISNHLKNPEVRMVNVAIQHEFSKTFSAEIQYVGQFGFGLFGESDTNAPVIAADPAHPGFFYFKNQTPVDLTLPVSARPDNRFDAVRTINNSRTSHYNGLLISATKRFSSHVQFNASYTWSHALTSSEGFFGYFDGGLNEPGDPRNIRAELGPALNDMRHAANFGVVLDSGRVTKMRIARLFTNDLSLSWLGQLQSGRPYPFSTGTTGYAAALFGTSFSGIGFETPQRPNVLPDGTISTAGIAAFSGNNALFGPGAVAACTSAGFAAVQCNSIQNTFLAPADASTAGARDVLSGEVVDFQLLNGNMGKNAGRQSPFYRFDVSLKKTLKLPRVERISLELRADAFNVLNHSNWQGFNMNNITGLGFGILSPAATAGQGFFDCTSCVRPNGTLVGNNGRVLNIADIQNGKLDSNLLKPSLAGFFGGIGNPSSADIARTLQLSFHVRF